MKELIQGLMMGSVCAISCIACGAEGPGGSGDPQSARVASADVLFEEPYSENGKITVQRDDSGKLVVGVSGSIGSDDARASLAALSGKTLLETYTALRGKDAVAPDYLRELSAELDEQRGVERTALRPDDVRFDLTRIAIHPKDANAFYSNACVLLGGGFTGHTPKECPFRPNWHSICTFGNIGTSDISIAWNESPSWSSHTLSNNSFVQRIPPWTYYVMGWSGVYSNQYSCLTLDSGQGQIGVTWHDYFTDHVVVGI